LAAIPLAFGNPKLFPTHSARCYEWLVPVVEIKNEHFDTARIPAEDHKVPRCVYVKANYVRCPGAGLSPWAAAPHAEQGEEVGAG
jgi:hypothetical protein